MYVDIIYINNQRGNKEREREREREREKDREIETQTDRLEFRIFGYTD